MNLNEKLKKYRLSQDEYNKICEVLDRDPQGIEWAIFSALWSEHCSYKSSKIHLKKLFNQSPRVLQSVGENAGIIDLDDGEKIAFKMESHNHPSFIEPYQGAATGVGGILRDIFTMGARPIALANYLCFGQPSADRMKTLVQGVVRGIGGYGNCVGVPTITGQTHFHESYNENILVNAMAVGYFGPKDPVCLSGLRTPGNYVVYVGAKTGRDGIHGASMASESFTEDSASQRPTVQIGDPFYEKLLIEACLEVMKKDLVVAIQDMGAAGLTSSSFEMAENGGLGMDMNLSAVPLRDETMTPEDILLSESQERMLLTCIPEKFNELKTVFDKWGLDACVLGKVIEKPVVRLQWRNELLAEIDPKVVVSNAPQYDRKADVYQPEFSKKIDPESVTHKSTINDLKQALKSEHGGAKKWIYEQYDQRVGANTARDCGDSIGVVRLPLNAKAIGVALGCRPHIMRSDAYIGGRDSVIHPSLQLASFGFEPLAITDCLNFGNPEKSETMNQFVSSLRGMNEVCENLITPIISGNVSFYNETKNKNVSPTPSTGVVGLRPNLELLPTSHFVNENEDVVALTWSSSWTTGMYSEMNQLNTQAYYDSSSDGLDQFVSALTEIARKGVISSSRVVSKFGLGYALARMSLNGIGATVETKQDMLIEPLYQVVVSTPELKELLNCLDEKNISQLSVEVIGKTQKDSLTFNSENISVNELTQAYADGWGSHFETLE